MWGLVEYKKVCASSYIESKWTAEKIAPVNNEEDDKLNKNKCFEDVSV